MIYNDFQDIKISSLAFGAMRLPVIDNDDARIDENAVQEMVDYALANGVNYFDTAWGYHQGKSETVMGKALNKHPRESFYLASKFPGYDLSNMGKVKEIFEKQLEKCGVEYFDFYLYHNVCEMNIEQYLDKSFGIHEFLLEQKRNGRIRHLGFSVHGNLDTTKRFLNEYGKDMEFCQIQLNYIDYNFQNAKGKIELLKEWGMPVWVMEPVRGGKLAKLNENDTQRLAKLRPNESVVGWAFRFLQSVPEVKVVLSGMSNFEQIKQNIATFSSFEPANEEERATLFDIAKHMTSSNTLACTSCRYCTKYCPQQINIPHIIELYNEDTFTGGGFRAPMAMMAIDKEHQPSACIGCRSCEAVCPQSLKIADMMSRFADSLANR